MVMVRRRRKPGNRDPSKLQTGAQCEVLCKGFIQQIPFVIVSLRAEIFLRPGR